MVEIGFVSSQKKKKIARYARMCLKMEYFWDIMAISNKSMNMALINVKSKKCHALLAHVPKREYFWGKILFKEQINLHSKNKVK